VKRFDRAMLLLTILIAINSAVQLTATLWSTQ